MESELSIESAKTAERYERLLYSTYDMSKRLGELEQKHGNKKEDLIKIVEDMDNILTIFD